MWAWGGTEYNFFAGVYAGVIWTPFGWDVGGGWKTFIQLGWAHPTNDYIGINLVAILATLLLWRGRTIDSGRLLSRGRTSDSLSHQTNAGIDLTGP